MPAKGLQPDGSRANDEFRKCSLVESKLETLALGDGSQTFVQNEATPSLLG